MKARLMNEDYPDVEVIVCTNHWRFVPCRKDGEHYYSSDLTDARAVQKYMDDWKKNESSQ